MLNEPNEIKEQKRSDVCILTLRNDNIFTVEPKDGVTEQTLASMKKDFEIFKNWSDGNKDGFLADARRFKKFGNDARIYAQEKSPLFSDKYAIIIASGVSSYLANLFIYMNRPKIPTKTFTTKDKAVEWLNNYE